ncbi:MAG TPA: mevalonate kinase [Kofleriaceae bacterium]|jgi:mevalonate kinase|nr:mevalonate kinase [Kofleriaceae bacterium]
MTCVGYGKIILLGEHAVVYGYPALAAALDRGVTMAPIPTPAGGPLRLDLRAWNVAVTAQDDHPVGRSLAAIADALDAGRPPLSLIGDAQLPPGAGLGSSAALAVAIARALLSHAKRRLDVATLTRAAGASETLVHGRPSGVDVALAIAGGTGVFRRSTGLTRLSGIPPLRVLVGPSGTPRSTAAMVERVALATRSLGDDPRLRELGALTDSGTAALVAADLPTLGAAMNRAHALLADLGVSTPQLDALCAAAGEAGAHGAKLTGAGGGGAVIAIAPRDREDAVLAAWKQANIDGFVATVR